MSEKQPNQEELAQAVAKDYYAGIQNDLANMSPGQLAVTKKALADFEAKKADHSQRDMERKIARMSTWELEEMIRDGDDAKRRSNG
jgi:hypothetical protein